jgi:hypothetical protein
MFNIKASVLHLPLIEYVFLALIINSKGDYDGKLFQFFSTGVQPDRKDSAGTNRESTKKN